MTKINIFSVGIFASCLFATMGVVAAQDFGVAQGDGWCVSATVGALFTDNRDQVDDTVPLEDGTYLEKEEDTELSIGLHISYEHVFEHRYKFYLEYSPTYVSYDNPRDKTEEDSIDHTVNARIELSPGRRTYIKITDKYWWSGNKNWYFADPEDMYDPTITEIDDLNEDYYDNRLTPHLQYNFSEKNYMLVDGLWRIRRYDDNEVALDNDEDEMMGRIAIMRSPTRVYSIGFFGEYTTYDKESNNEEFDFGVDYYTIGLQTTIDFFGDESWVLHASSGYNMMKYEDESMDDEDMIGDSRVELSVHQKERLRGKFGFRYSQDYASVFPYSSEKNTVLFGTISRLLGRDNDYILGADFEYRMRDYERGDLDPDVLEYCEHIGLTKTSAERDSVFLRLYLNARFSKSCRGTLFYTYEDVDTDVSTTKSYQENVVGIKLTYDFL